MKHDYFVVENYESCACCPEVNAADKLRHFLHDSPVFLARLNRAGRPARPAGPWQNGSPQPVSAHEKHCMNWAESISGGVAGYGILAGPFAPKGD